MRPPSVHQKPFSVRDTEAKHPSLVKGTKTRKRGTLSPSSFDGVAPSAAAVQCTALLPPARRKPTRPGSPSPGRVVMETQSTLCGEQVLCVCWSSVSGGSRQPPPPCLAWKRQCGRAGVVAREKFSVRYEVQEICSVEEAGGQRRIGTHSFSRWLCSLCPSLSLSLFSMLV